MPSIFRILGYNIYFWSNENNEPIHVHICKNHPNENDTKVWVNFDGKVLLDETHKSYIDKKDLNKLLYAISDNHELIIEKWIQCFEKCEFNKKVFKNK